MNRSLFALAAGAALGLTTPAFAQGIVRHEGAAQMPILNGVTVPAGATTLYLSGQVPDMADASKPHTDPAAWGDTKAQSLSTFRKIEALLKAQGYGMGDVVKLTVFLVGDPKLGGKLDFQGFSQAYAQFFGTPEQPHKVARSVVQVSALVHPAFLVEIEAIAAKAP